jgi:hypothetical protein
MDRAPGCRPGKPERAEQPHRRPGPEHRRHERRRSLRHVPKRNDGLRRKGRKHRDRPLSPRRYLARRHAAEQRLPDHALTPAYSRRNDVYVFLGHDADIHWGYLVQRAGAPGRAMPCSTARARWTAPRRCAGPAETTARVSSTPSTTTRTTAATAATCRSLLPGRSPIATLVGRGTPSGPSEILRDGAACCGYLGVRPFARCLCSSLAGGRATRLSMRRVSRCRRCTPRMPPQWS